MFTPQRKGWQGTRSGGLVSVSNGRNLSKGKAVAFVDELPPPPIGSLNENGEIGFDEGGDGGMEDWRRFKEAGMLDEEYMERKDRQTLIEKVAKLENELYDYQYNMGILLIEKNEWASKHEELSRILEETQEILKREKSSQHMTLSEAERREENLRKALGVERQCVADLEKALREMQGEHAHGKREAESKISNANSLVTHIEEKSMEVEKKMKIADDKHAEANRKTTELERRLQEVEARENVIQSERLTLAAEREAHETTFHRQKEDLLVWEKKLHEGELKLCESRRALREKEDVINEAERLGKLKDKEVDEKFEEINSSLEDLRLKEKDIKSRLSDLLIKEEEADSMKCNLDNKEKELREWEKKLHARESMELQTLVDEHKAKLETELRDLELEMQRKRAELDLEFKSKFDDVEKKETEIKHIEVKLAKKEEALESKSLRLRVKEKDIEEKLKLFKEKEKLFTTEENKLEEEKKQLVTERENLENIKDEVEKLRTEVMQEKSQLQEDVERLKVAEQERIEHNRLRSELKQEIQRSRQNVESLLKEREELRLEREKFETEWEALDEKKAEISEYMRRHEEEKNKFETVRNSEEDRFRSEKAAIQDHLQRELDAVKQERESLRASLEKERIALLEKAEEERKEFLQGLERKMQDFESEVQRRNEDLELQLAKKEREFQEMKEKESNYINKMKETVEWETEELKSERGRLQKEKQELVLNKQQLEINQFDMRKDIEELSALIKKLKDQREQFIKERSHFLVFVEKLKNCSECGDIVKEFVVADLQVAELEDTLPLSISVAELVKNPSADIIPSGKKQVESSPGGSGSGQLSWLQKCKSKLFNSPPPKKGDQRASQAAAPLCLEKNRDEVNGMKNSVAPCTEIANTKLASALSDDLVSVRNDKSNQVSRVDDGHQSEVSANAGKVTQGTGRRRVGRKTKATLHRTSTIKATVEDAQVFLGKNAETTDISTSHIHGSAYMADQSHDNSGFTEKADSLISRKRGRSRTTKGTESEANGCDSEGQSESVALGGRRKRRQTVTPAAETPVSRRYNLRRPRNAALEVPTESADVKNDAKEAGIHGRAAINTKSHPEDNIADVDVVSSGDAAARFARITSGTGESDDPAEVAEIKETVEVLPTNNEDHNNSDIPDDLGYEDEEGEEEEDQPGEASVGKKLWHFFTT